MIERLVLSLQAGQLSLFYPLLQAGVTVPAVVDCPLRSLLCEQLAIPADYVTGRITTIFLNNRPVDDLDGTVIHDGARVSLSAAMPGLVGAVMRRSGFYAALRQGITHHGEAGGAPTGCRGTVRMKLFNLLLPELGPVLLAHGILVEPAELAELMKELPAGVEPPRGAALHLGPVLLRVSFED